MENRARRLHARCAGVGAGFGRAGAGGIGAHGPGARRRNRGWPPLSSRGGDRGGRRPSGGRRALGAQGATRSASRSCPPSSGCSGRESCHHPMHEVIEMKKTPMRAAADGCSGTPAAARRPRGHPVTWMRRSSPWTMRRIRPTSMRSSPRGSAANTSRPRSRCTRTRSRASARTSTTSMTTSSTRFAWRPEMTWRRAARHTPISSSSTRPTGTATRSCSRTSA